MDIFSHGGSNRFTAVVILFVLLTSARPKVLRVPAYWWLIGVTVASINAILAFTPWQFSSIHAIFMVAVLLVMVVFAVLAIRNVFGK